MIFAQAEFQREKYGFGTETLTRLSYSQEIYSLSARTKVKRHQQLTNWPGGLLPRRSPLHVAIPKEHQLYNYGQCRNQGRVRTCR